MHFSFHLFIQFYFNFFPASGDKVLAVAGSQVEQASK
jgi:hypothetical protein